MLFQVQKRLFIGDFEAACDSSLLKHHNILFLVDVSDGSRSLSEDFISSVGCKLLNIDVLNVFDQTNGSGSDVDQVTSDAWDLAVPDLSIGAEYNILPALIVRGGIRSTVGAGRAITTNKTFEGPEDDAFQLDVNQTIANRPVALGFEANGGVGIRVRRFSLDATLGGLFFGQGQASFLSRVDMSFSFD